MGFEKGTEVEGFNEGERVLGSIAALHISTGDAALESALQIWLERHGLAVVRFDDVYTAAVFVLRERAAPPSFALVGLDWLRPDEAQIVERIRRIWPRIPVILYGEPVAGAIPMRQGVVHCPSAAELDAAVNELVSRWSAREQGQGVEVRPEGPPSCDAGPAMSSTDAEGQIGADTGSQIIVTDAELVMLLGDREAVPVARGESGHQRSDLR